MKKILLTVFTISVLFSINQVNAQPCGTNPACTAGPNTTLGFPAPDSIACIPVGVQDTTVIPFKMYNTFNYIGVHQIDSITIDTIFNLPCGMCWAVNNVSKTYAANEIGCLSLTGTTYDLPGQYNLRLVITAYLHNSQNNTSTPVTVGPGTVDSAGIFIWVRVNGTGGSCAPVNTTYGFTDNTTGSCSAGINEVAANVASLSIMPNPMNSNATLSFTVEKSADYTMRIIDLTGQVVSVKEIQANPGINNSTIERGRLSAGIYFLSLTNGVSSVTRKFTIMD